MLVQRGEGLSEWGVCDNCVMQVRNGVGGGSTFFTCVGRCPGISCSTGPTV